jgi:hypothetical protein
MNNYCLGNGLVGLARKLLQNLVVVKGVKMKPIFKKKFIINKNDKGWYIWDSINNLILDNRYFDYKEEAENYRDREIHLNQ